MQANRCSSCSPSQKFVISAGELIWPGPVVRINFELHVPQNGGLAASAGLLSSERNLAFRRCPPGYPERSTSDTQLLSELFVGTSESSVQLRWPLRSPSRAESAAVAQ